MATMGPNRDRSVKIRLAPAQSGPHSGMMPRPPLFSAALLLGTILFNATAFSQEAKEEAPPSLGDLFNKVKDIKVPESVSGLPKQITELKESYLETTKTLEALKVEVDTLRAEVYELRKDNEALRAAVGEKVKETGIAALLKPTEIAATDLVSAYQSEAGEAATKYRDRYLKVVGTISSFETGSQSIVIYLKADGTESRVRCELQTGADFFVDVLPTQGRLISRNDRRTLLSVGQPVAILGTCKGAQLNVELANCSIVGLTEKRIAEPAKP
jgi:regulator of replication initiation timing